MIGYLKGKFVQKTPASIIVDVNGVGYEVHISLHTYSAIQDQEEGMLHIHFIVREDAQLLYGFFDLQEKQLFIQLLSVSGIGANTARVILSYMKPDEIIHSIAAGDSKALERVKGIGKKTAERAVLELKDKIGKTMDNSAFPSTTPSFVPSVKTEALGALLALGINKTQAEQAMQKVLAAEPSIGIEELIKKTLKAL